MIFSNITSYEKFPKEFGQIDESINYLIRMAETPYPDEELLTLRLIK